MARALPQKLTSAILCLLLACLVVPAWVLPCAALSAAPENDSVDRRVDHLLSKLTFDEKILLLAGYKDDMHVAGIPRLGIPELKFSDGPLGVRCWGKATAYPAGPMLASTWDTQLAQSVGRSLGRDARARGVHVLLGPAVNIYRLAQGGRNFEYMGEDPYLASRMAAAVVKGIQEQGVAACIKHFAANNQETRRMTVDTIVGEPELQEIFFPAFKAALQEGGCWTAMCAYNKLNGHYCSADKFLLTDTLRKRWRFEGLLMSDWGAVHDAEGPLTAGCDLEMGRREYYTADNIKALMAAGKLTQAQIDEHIRRLLRTELSMGFFTREQLDNKIPLDDPQSAAVALREAREGLVLLKNDNALLPLSRDNVHSIVVMGPNADPAITGGGGSSATTPFKAISLAQAIIDGAGKDISVHAMRTTASLGASNQVQADSMPKSGAKAQAEAAAIAEIQAKLCTPFTAEESALLKAADAVVLSLGFNPIVETEGQDRPYGLPEEQKTLLAMVRSINPRTIVVLNAGGNADVQSWMGDAAALIHAWYPGQNGNQAVCEAIFGDINPSGRLPDTFEKRWEDSPAYGSFPGDAANGGTVVYSEGVFCGYRWYDTRQIEPAFPFGYGLSYTTFKIEGLKAAPTATGAVGISFSVTNTGKRDGADVVQIYVRPKDDAPDRPLQQLKAFTRVQLAPGESKPVNLLLDRDAFAMFDADKHGWVFPPGIYEIAAGQSSRDVQASVSITR